MSLSDILYSPAPDWSNLYVKSINLVSGSTLNYYEQVTVAGNWAGAAASATTVNVIRIGKQVTLTCIGCAAGTYGAATLTFALPARFRPGLAVQFPINGVNNAAAAGLTAIIYDTITIGVGAGALDFTAAAGEVKPFSVTYNLD